MSNMRKLGRKADDRNHLVRNLATSLLLFETIETTEAKAKTVKGFVERIISRSKKNDLSAIRYLNSVLFDRNATKKMIEELVPRYKDRQSGFITSARLEQRKGDRAPMMRLELMDKKVYVTEPIEEKAKKSDKKETKSKDVEIKVKTKSEKNGK